MSLKLKLLSVGGIVLSTIIASTPASAATVIKAFMGGPFSVANPLGTIPAIKLSKKNTYDFTFSLVGDPGSFASVQVLAQLLTKGASIPEPIQFSLYKGVPTGGVFLAQSSLDFSPTIAFKPTVSDYYVKVDVISANNEVAGGTFTTAVPEPASWAMMLVGFGALGVALRRRATKDATITA
jgi:hypothetical protein